MLNGMMMNQNDRSFLFIENKQSGEPMSSPNVRVMWNVRQVFLCFGFVFSLNGTPAAVASFTIQKNNT